MLAVPSSPRLRRRLTRLGVAVGVAGAIAGVALLVPEPHHNVAPTGKEGPAQVAPPINKHVSPATRRAIDATLDRFIPAGVARRSPATAWRLAGPELKSGSTLREWRRGVSPIPYYPADNRPYHGWTTIDAGPHWVDFNLLVHPSRGSKTAAWVFSGEMVQRGSRWLVNRLYTIATIERPAKSGPREVGPADFAAGAPSTGPPPRTKSGVIGSAWLLVVVGLVGLVLLVPLLYGLVGLVRGRGVRRRETPGHRELPPLPARIARREEMREPAGHSAEQH